MHGWTVMKNTITGLMAAVVGLAVVAGTLAILGLLTKQYGSQPFNILRQVKRNHR